MNNKTRNEIPSNNAINRNRPSAVDKFIKTKIEQLISETRNRNEQAALKSDRFVNFLLTPIKLSANALSCRLLKTASSHLSLIDYGLEKFLI